MSTENFDIMLYAVENMGDITENYFPEVDELKQYSSSVLKDKFLPIIAYFASDPFSRNGTTTGDVKCYMETVSFCKHFLYAMETG